MRAPRPTLQLRPVARVLGRLTLVIAAAMLVPAAVAFLHAEARTTWGFLVAAAVTAAAGGGLAWAGRGATSELYRREGVLIVVGGWLLASLFGALPFLAAGTLVNPVDALFESTSGFTTTGATVFTDIAAAGPGILFWRSFSQWLGGMGIIVLFVALLPEIGPGTRFLYQLEVPGPTAETLRPRIHDTAVVLWRIYLGLTAAMVVLLLLAGLDLYDALTHTFSTMSTGGFSPRNGSIAELPSPWVRTIIVVFMLIAGGNFSLYYGLRRRRGWNLLADTELRLYLGIVAGATAVVATDLIVHRAYPPGGRVMLDALFQVSSIITTTGFATVDYESWPPLSRMLLVMLMFVGGCAGSTSGSMKVMRMVVGLKSAYREVRLNFSPTTVAAVFVGGKAVPEGVVRSVAGFFILYLTCWAIGALLLTLGGPTLVTAATASATTLGNVGPGLEAVGPVGNFAFFGDVDKLVMVLLMWLGRLELYAVLALFSVAFWKR